VNENVRVMQRVYLLLRKNHQTGPYTIDELLQQQLLETDLIWVQGTSQAWSFPWEVPELKEVLQNSQNPEDVQIPARPASSSVDELEQRAEELRQRVLLFPQKYIIRKLSVEDEPSVEALRDMAQQRIEFVDHRKKESRVFEWMSGVMVMLIVAASVYGGGKFFSARTNQNHPPALVTKSVSVDHHAAKVIVPLIPQPMATVYEEKKKDTVAVPEVKQTPSVVPKRKRLINREALRATAIKRMSIPPHAQADSPSTSPLQNIEQPQNEVMEPAPRTIVTAEPVEKKKSGFFKGLFRKKKKEGEKLPERDIKADQNQQN
jgi:hypothetical protein